jgi:hypothetical protein
MKKRLELFYNFFLKTGGILKAIVLQNVVLKIVFEMTTKHFKCGKILKNVSHITVLYIVQFMSANLERRGDFFPRTTRILQFSSEMQQT